MYIERIFGMTYSVTSAEIVSWLEMRRDKFRQGRDNIGAIEIDFYDNFFECHSEVLEHLWVRVME